MHRQIAASLLFVLAACAPEEAPRGKLSAAIVGTGGGGAQYRLPAGTMLYVSVGSFSDTFSLDGDTTSVAFDVPVGDVEATLIHPAGYTDHWPLEKLLPGGGTDPVTGQLATPMPMTFTVLEDETTHVVISFRVAGGIITFAEGSVEVSVDVTEVGATSGSFSINSTVAANAVTTGASTPADLIARLPDESATDLFIGITGTITSAWQLYTSDTVCASATVDMSEDESQGWSDLLDETNGNFFQFCVRDLGDGNAQLQMSNNRFGEPTTDTFADNTSEVLGYSLLMIGEFAPSPFVDGTLDLGALDGEFAMPITVWTTVGAAESWYQGIFQGDLFLRFIPLE